MQHLLCLFACVPIVTNKRRIIHIDVVRIVVRCCQMSALSSVWPGNKQKWPGWLNRCLVLDSRLMVQEVGRKMSSGHNKKLRAIY